MGEDISRRGLLAFLVGLAGLTWWRRRVDGKPRLPAYHRKGGNGGRAICDVAGTITTYSYDGTGRLVSVDGCPVAGWSPPGALRACTTYTYEAGGKRR